MVKEQKSTYNPITDEMERDWIRYSDGMYEPVPANGPVAGARDPMRKNLDWWHERKPMDWKPKKEELKTVSNDDLNGGWSFDDDIEALGGSIWTWRANPDACPACQALHGQTFKYYNEPKRPHPNCKCEIIGCDDEVVYGKWKHKKTGEPSYELVAILFGGFSSVGTAVWTRTVPITEIRTKKIYRTCEGEGRKLIHEGTEERIRNKIEKRRTQATRWSTGRDIEQGDVWTATNPWTGETIVRRFK